MAKPSVTVPWVPAAPSVCAFDFLLLCRSGWITSVDLSSGSLPLFTLLISPFSLAFKTFLVIFISKLFRWALARWLSQLEHCPVRQRFVGSSPRQGACLGCEFHPRAERAWDVGNGNRLMVLSHPLFLSLPKVNF